MGEGKKISARGMMRRRRQPKEPPSWSPSAYAVHPGIARCGNDARKVRGSGRRGPVASAEGRVVEDKRVHVPRLHVGQPEVSKQGEQHPPAPL